MAVTTTLVASDFMPPNGPLDPQMKPGMETRDVEAFITGLIAKALTDPRADVDEPDTVIDPLVRFWFYQSVVIAMATKPASVTVAEKGSSAFLIQQIEIIEGLMNEAKQEVDALGAIESPLFPGTLTTKTDVTWYGGRTPR